MKEGLPLTKSLNFSGLMVLKSCKRVLWESSISHDFTAFCTISSREPFGHSCKINQRKHVNQSNMISHHTYIHQYIYIYINIYIYVCIYLERDIEIQHLGPALFKKLVNTIIGGRATMSPHNGVLFIIQERPVLISYCLISC